MDVMECDAQGNFLWLVVSEVVPLVENTEAKPESIARSIERWCAHGVLSPFVRKATNEEILALLNAGRIHGFPQKDKGIYVIHRSGLACLTHRPKAGRKRRRRAG